MPKERHNPRVSVNKLAEYLVAPAARRRKLLEEQKRPPTYRVNWYADAERTIIQYILAQGSAPALLQNDIKRLVAQPALTEQEAVKNQTNAEAISAFQKLSKHSGLKHLTFSPAPANPQKLSRQNVEISVRPELVASGKDAKGDYVGVCKLYLSKQFPLTANTGAFITALLYEFSGQYFGNSKRVAHDACKVIDVFGGSVISAPRAMTRRMRDVDAACREIALVWPTV